MANKTSWVAGAGAGLTYANCGFTLTDFNSLANGSTVLASSAVANSSSLDQYADVSVSLVVGGTTTVNSYLVLYLLPLNQDGTTYGDGSSSGATAPVASYAAATVAVRTGVTSGNAVVATFRNVLLPPGDFKYAILNTLGVALNASAAAAVKHITYNENLNA